MTGAALSGLLADDLPRMAARILERAPVAVLDHLDPRSVAMAIITAHATLGTRPEEPPPAAGGPVSIIDFPPAGTAVLGCRCGRVVDAADLHWDPCPLLHPHAVRRITCGRCGP